MSFLEHLHLKSCLKIAKNCTIQVEKHAKWNSRRLFHISSKNVFLKDAELIVILYIELLNIL
mgnify:CR=1 FL=1